MIGSLPHAYKCKHLSGSNACYFLHGSPWIALPSPNIFSVFPPGKTKMLLQFYRSLKTFPPAKKDGKPRYSAIMGTKLRTFANWFCPGFSFAGACPFNQKTRPPIFGTALNFSACCGVIFLCSLRSFPRQSERGLQYHNRFFSRLRTPF